MAKTKSTETKQSFEDLVKELNKKYSGSNDQETFDLSTGSILLDQALGGGLRSGRITEIMAWEGAGKTTICLHLVAEAQKRGLNVLYVDSEFALDETYAKNIGCDWEKLKPTIFQPSCGEDAFDYAQKLLASGDLDLLIFDSTSGMIPKSQLEAEPGGSNMGKHALLFSKEVPKINSLTARNNCVTVFISQFREKIGIIFGSPETTQAGNTLKFFASNRIELRRSMTKEGEDVTGQNTRFKVIKCKTNSPYGKGEFPIRFAIGIDKITEIVDLAKEYLDKETFNVWGAKTKFDGEEYKTEDFYQLLKDNEDLYQSLRSKVLEKLSPKEEEISQ